MSELRLRQRKTSPRTLHRPVLPLANPALCLGLWVASIISISQTQNLIPELLEAPTTPDPIALTPFLESVRTPSTSTLGAVGVE